VTSERPWPTRIAWALAGGAWGAWVGFRGLYNILPHMNRDTAAPVFVWGMFGALSLVGLAVGAALAFATGLGASGLLQRLRVGRAPATAVASLAVVFVLWLAAQLVGRAYPGLRPPQAEARPAARISTPEASGRAMQNPCAAPPPTDARERASWDLECK
jgi:hypothetical protein